MASGVIGSLGSLAPRPVASEWAADRGSVIAQPRQAQDQTVPLRTGEPLKSMLHALAMKALAAIRLAVSSR